MLEINAWNEAIDEFLVSAKSKYKATYQEELKYKLGTLSRWAIAKGIRLGDFSRRNMDQFLAERSQTVSKRSLETDARRAVVFFRYCNEVRLIEQDPLRAYRVAKAPAAHVHKPSAEDLQKLLKAVTNRWDVRLNAKVRDQTPRERRFYRTRDYALLAGLIETACRVSELCDLLLADFDAGGRQITFRETKGGDARTVPVSAEWVGLVEAWLKIRPDIKTCSTLFMGDQGNPLNKNRVGEQMDRYLEFAGLPHFTRHSIRHYSITEMGKVNVVSAARQAGHRDLKVTMGYLHRDAESIRTHHAEANLLGNVTQIERTASKPKPRRII